jgi:hypothetical protein
MNNQISNNIQHIIKTILWELKPSLVYYVLLYSSETADSFWLVGARIFHSVLHVSRGKEYILIISFLYSYSRTVVTANYIVAWLTV